MKKLIAAMLGGICICLLCGCGRKPDLILDSGTAALSGREQEISSEGEEGGKDKAGIYVYICGAVANPGVYEMDADSRIYELVEAAGGLKDGADPAGVNLAESLTDGEMVRIPDASETAGSEQGADGGASSGMSADGKVNINTATEEQLMTLPGIGESKARQIIAYRDGSGAFRKIEDIMQVEGIKEGTFQKLKDSITVQ